MRCPDHLTTNRLSLQRPRRSDAELIFSTYASDPDVCRYLAWPRHESVTDSIAFVDFSDAEWARGPAGPYLIWHRRAGALLGSTGLTFEESEQATTGYVIARKHWGNGYASEALRAMMTVAAGARARRLTTVVHPAHEPSRRVLLRCGFNSLGLDESPIVFPNLDSEPVTVERFAATLPDAIRGLDAKLECTPKE